jgi:outer membrane protein OmpA-like peptidoglycan-associated protein
MRQFKSAMLVLTGSLVLGGCATEQQTRTAVGTGAGAATGAAIGGAVGDGRGAAVGGLIGAGVGAAAGYNWDVIKRKLGMDTQGSQVQVSQEREGEVKLNVPGNVSFATGSATIDTQLYPVLNRVASTLKEYPATTVTVIGHTDNVGGEAANMNLSRERAASVVNYLNRQGIAMTRMHAVGRGEAEPVADNSTEAGRAQNRRVELIVRQDAG